MSDDTLDDGSRVEAVAAVLHHHHPADANIGVAHGALGPRAVLAGTVAAVLTVAAVILLALSIGGGR